jgi:hypothetical protein
MNKILIASPIRQTEEIFKMYLKSLASLKIPSTVNVEFYFLLHNCEYLEGYLSLLGNYNVKHKLVSDEIAPVKYSDGTKRWNHENFSRLIEMKHDIVEYAKSKEFDYIFMVDSDILLQPETLEKLYEHQKSIVSEVFWTRWVETELSEFPNCWDYDHYGFLGAERIISLKNPGLYQVGGLGAVTLIKTSVFDMYVNYKPLRNVSFSAWEDRSFCIRAEASGYDLWIDTALPAFHIYRSEDIEYAKKFVDKHYNRDINHDL